MRGEVMTRDRYIYDIDVWKKVPLARTVHIAVDDDFQTSLVKFRQAICLPPSGISSTILPWICWSLWTARNRLIFEDKSFTANEVMIKGLVLAREWIGAQESKSTILQRLPHARVGHPEDARDFEATCHTDASWDPITKKAGLAWIISQSSHSLPQEGAQSML
ncbi:hypothetical protein IGI04_000126 [Brassica rapa subsp. trilocularis]|uniref:RNase H type-1 domain-containing protein n=1 Tax=Brassica rapa subsp. trilocularis TaxID=1813537 RepID=A0ABQ7NS60_BRACM|nr:hypothetical protein IGI04_000126 [Brassica rapa subsp. trilocularis]